MSAILDKFKALPAIAKIVILFAIAIAMAICIGGVHGETNDIIVNGNSNMTVDGSQVIVTQENETPLVNTSELVSVVAGAVANITANMSVVNETVVPDNWTSPRIMQGQCVEIGRTYDISGLGWYTGYIGWYGSYEDAFSPSNDTLKYRIEVPNSRKKLLNYYIDPKEFFTRQGYWYVVYKNEESSANNRLFYVSSKCEYVPKQSELNVSKNNTQPIRLPVKEGGGYILAKGDGLQYPYFGINESRVWIFNEDGIYDREYNVSFNATPNETVLVRPDDFKSSPSDIYTIAVITKGTNNIYEARYNKSSRSIISPFVDGNKIDTTGFTPGLVLKALREYMNSTIDDQMQTVTVDVQDPQIYVAQMDETRVSDNMSILDIRGYTNLAAGTKIFVDVDSYQSNVKVPSTETAYTLTEGDPLEWRQFHVLLPILYRGQTVGDHFLLVRTEDGSVEATAPFYIRREEIKNYVKPETIMWVDNSPYLKPIIIVNETVKEVTVIKEKIVKEIEPLDYDKLASEELRQVLPIVYGTAISIVMGIYLFWVAARTYVRRKHERENPVIVEETLW